MQSNPVVSIGMPVYNAAPFLDEAISSLLSQAYGDFELIISNNASTDESGLICSQYAQSDSRIRYYVQDYNMGSARNFEFVLEKAVGKYFMWAAADDIWDKYWIQDLLGAIDEHVICVVGRIRLLNDSGEYYKTLTLPNYSMNQHLRFFWGHDKGACLYAYGLFFRDVLMSHKYNEIGDLAIPGFWDDAVYVNYLLAFGSFASVKSTFMVNREHAGNTGKKIWAKYYGIKRILIFAYPPIFYERHFKILPYPYNLIVLPVMFVKHVLVQLGIWYRSLVSLLFDRGHFISRYREIRISRYDTINQSEKS